MKFTEQFKDYVCVDDSIETEIDGITYTAYLEADTETTPMDYDCYSESAIQAWKDDEWYYCGIVIAASKGNVKLSDSLVSLWGVECNIMDGGNAHLTDVANDLLPEAVQAAKERLESMRERLRHNGKGKLK